MFKKNWTRRDFLKAAGVTGGAAMLSSFLPLLSTEAEAQAANGAKRFLFLTTGNGTILPNWRSNGAGAPFENGMPLPELMGPILSPLNNYRDRMLMLDGIDMASVYQPDGRKAGNTGHGAATVIWTGRMVGDDLYPDTASIDWRINQQIGGGREMLNIATFDNNQGPEAMSQCYTFDNNGTPIYTEFHPTAAFDSVFGTDFSVSTDPGASSRRLNQRVGVIEMLRGDIGRLKSQLPTVDRERLDLHFENMVALEERVRAASRPIVCDVNETDRPEEPSRRYFRNNPEVTIDLYANLVAQAFACDQIRVASWAVTCETSFRMPTLQEFTESFLPDLRLHGLTHMTRGDSAEAVEARRLVTAYSRWTAAKVAQILDTLDAYGVLEETVVVWGMNQQHAGIHTNRNCPHIIFQGSADGPFAANKYVRWGEYDDDDAICSSSVYCHSYQGGVSNNDLLITLGQAAGLGISTIGNEEHCSPNGLNDDLLS